MLLPRVLPWAYEADSLSGNLLFFCRILFCNSFFWGNMFSYVLDDFGRGVIFCFRPYMVIMWGGVLLCCDPGCYPGLTRLIPFQGIFCTSAEFCFAIASILLKGLLLAYWFYFPFRESSVLLQNFVLLPFVYSLGYCISMGYFLTLMISLFGWKLLFLQLIIFYLLRYGNW